MLFLSSCSAIWESGIPYKTMLTNLKSGSVAKLNLEGAYSIHRLAHENFYLEKPFFFFKNGLVYHEYGNAVDSLDFDSGILEYLKEKKTWGTYEIIDDTINVCINFEYYYGGYAIYRQTNFQGIIKDKNTIRKWHVINPYPKIKEITFKEYLPLFVDTVNLYFKPLSIKSFMDSVSEKAWINKYRDYK